MKIISFTGRLRIVRIDDAGALSLPFVVEVWDDDENERDERLERKFRTAIQAERYARGLTADTVHEVPLVYDDELPSNRWTPPLRIRTEA